MRDLMSMLGLSFLDKPVHEVADLLIAAASQGGRQQVFFVNAHCVNTAAVNNTYAEILQSAPYVFADGVGMALASRICGTVLQNNVNGTDLFPLLCERAAREKVPFAFLGAKPGVAAECARRISIQYPGLQVVWIEHGYLSGESEAQCIAALNRSGAAMLFVAKGVPLQEIWIHQNAAKVHVPVILGVGALFDFYSGAIPRAPEWIRRLRLEWLFRLCMEPARMFRRYVIGIPLFILRVIRHRIVVQ
jgi:exopolysaccharide biosynthesis WecB/TagA/CpsF family protein